MDLNIEEVIGSIGTADMNGREISNSINTAQTLAGSEGEKLKLEHLQTIVQVWSEFAGGL